MGLLFMGVLFMGLRFSIAEKWVLLLIADLF